MDVMADDEENEDESDTTNFKSWLRLSKYALKLLMLVWSNGSIT